MIRNIKEYPIRIEQGIVQHIYLPTASQVVDIRKTDAGVSLIVLSGLSSDNQLRSFEVCMPNSNIYADKVTYLGSFEEDTLGILYIVEVGN